jgi:hypothetical protein
MAAKRTAAKKTAAKKTTPPREPVKRGLSGGDLVRIKSDVEDAPASYGLVVDTVSGNEHRKAAAYVVRLPDAVHLELDQVETV